MGASRPLRLPSTVNWSCIGSSRGVPPSHALTERQVILNSHRYFLGNPIWQAQRSDERTFAVLLDLFLKAKNLLHRNGIAAFLSHINQVVNVVEREAGSGLIREALKYPANIIGFFAWLFGENTIFKLESKTVLLPLRFSTSCTHVKMSPYLRAFVHTEPIFLSVFMLMSSLSGEISTFLWYAVWA